MPVVGPIRRHRQQIPRDHRHLGVELLDQRRRVVGDDRFAVAVDQPAHLRKVRCRRCRIGVDEIDHGVQAFVAGDEVAGLVHQRAFGQRGDVAPDHQDRDARRQFLNRCRHRARSRHVLRRRRRLMTVDRNHRQPRRQFLDAHGHVCRAKAFGFGVDDDDRLAVRARKRGDQTGPHRVLDRCQGRAQRLIHAGAAGRIDQDEVEWHATMVQGAAPGGHAPGGFRPRRWRSRLGV